MKHLATCGLAFAMLVFGVSAVVAAQRLDDQSSPLYGVKLPEGYRDWKLISVAHEAGKNNDIRAILGNDIAVKAFREGKRPFPEGAVIVRLAWRFESSPRNDSVFPAPQSFVAGVPVNVQVSVKDARRYAASGGWGYGQFENGVANHDPALTRACFTCHAKLDALDKNADLVFTDYSQ
ncbi:cytochrome P460 family protein [Sphingomonas sp. UNC305MFCol5.2]|uniref:cytochrome P460 family protein n=1 Tax=Sphingomonas sp. UNC305MFCol5.2 TaxID=1449076 RepID=UPI0003FD67EB|nr:cytochrome P460 family protein [Sphingomonas sp. UNC305MFCol5.2]